MLKIKHFRVAALSLSLIVAGCGYSDYPGHPGHKTQNEAYVPSLSTVITGFGDEYDGTYVYSVKYNNRGWQNENFNFNVKITSYKNVVTDSYPHRPNIFPDADDFNKATGFAGGDFSRYWIAEDKDPDVVGGLDNFIQTQPLDGDGNWIEPGLILSIDVPEQEVDRVDWDLQSNVTNASEILSNLISNNGKLSNLQLTVNGLEINGRHFKVDDFELGVSSNDIGLGQVSIKKQKSISNLVDTIVNNTENLNRVKLKLHFTNGMAIALPKSISIMFNHSVLKKLAK